LKKEEKLPMRFTETTGTLELFAFLAVVGWMIIGSIQAVKKAQRKREMEHAERMRALEMGLVPQPRGLDWPAAAVCIAIGAGVPIGSFVVAWLASLTADVPKQIWLAPVFVSFAAIGSTRKLALRIIEPKGNARTFAREKSASSVEKPVFDPETFDVVGSRG
jgi:hypothetical protein